jgi:hypothetical protein
MTNGGRTSVPAAASRLEAAEACQVKLTTTQYMEFSDPPFSTLYGHPLTNTLLSLPLAPFPPSTPASPCLQPPLCLLNLHQPSHLPPAMCFSPPNRAGATHWPWRRCRPVDINRVEEDVPGCAVHALLMRYQFLGFCHTYTAPPFQPADCGCGSQPAKLAG